MTRSPRTHFILTKQWSSTPDGAVLSASESAKALLSWGYWPLFSGTRCRKMVKPGHKVLIYTAGQEEDCRKVVASATVGEVQPWQGRNFRCPIILEGIPVSVLQLSDIKVFPSPVDFMSKLDELSFIPENRQKWGVAMMGGMRSIDHSDFQALQPG